MKVTLASTIFAAFAFASSHASYARDDTAAADAEAFAPMPVVITVACSSKNNNNNGSLLKAVENNLMPNILQGSYVSDSARLFVAPNDVAAVVNQTSTWFGEWTCVGDNNCRTISQADADLVAWEAAVVKILDDPSCRVSMKPAAVQASNAVATTTPENDSYTIPVAIKLLCRHHQHDLEHLHVPAGAYLAHAAQDAYNTVHGESKGDDFRLSGLYYHTSKGMAMMPSAAAADMDETTDDENKNRLGYSWWYWYHHHYHANIHGSWGWGCGYDDDADMMMLTKKKNDDPLKKAWEAEFVRLLHLSDYPLFNKIKECTFEIDEDDSVAAVVPPVVSSSLRGGGKNGGAAVESAY